MGEWLSTIELRYLSEYARQQKCKMILSCYYSLSIDYLGNIFLSYKRPQTQLISLQSIDCKDCGFLINIK